jgi:spermidine synthase
VDEYRDVLRLNPKDAMTCNNLAWLLATHPQAAVRNAAEAVELAERAVALTGRNHPVALNTLAAAYAEAGRFDDAIATAETAMQKARSMGQPAMAREISSLLALYRSGKPVRQEPQWLPQGRTPPQSAPETP